MGTWGVNNFENDTALDWIADLVEDNNFELLLSTLRMINENNSETEIDASEADEALAAAEIVAAFNGKPCLDLPEELVEWINENSVRLNTELKELAKQAIINIRNKSELKDLWEETEDYQDWLNVLDNLQERLV